MADRLSTQILKQQGGRRLSVYDGSRYINTFQDATGAEHFFDAANVALADMQLVSDSLNVEQFFVAKSFFMKRGASETTAISMAVLALDAAKIMGVSVMKALTPLVDSDDIMLQFETYVAANIFRPQSTQQTYMVAKDNKKNLRVRDITA